MELAKLFVTLGLKGKEQFDQDVEGAAKSGSKLGEKIGGAMKAVGGVTVAAFGAAATATGVLLKGSIESFAEYEQLVGGVETLFKDSSGKVMGYANNAYKTAGMSANEYMTTVTGFSAALLQSLGGDTDKAAEKANMAITDMSDNANKMGTDMASIQNAYQGFSKQNYTMLDNLKLGYGGTKEEMQRLIDDANALREAHGLNADLTIDSYSDVVDAIHTVQTEMGITGTTATEASTTIQGSLSTVKSSWSNLLTGLSDESANMDELIENFVTSVQTFASNIVPVIGTALQGIGSLVEGLAPVITAALPALATEVLPGLVSSGIGMVESLLSGITENADAIASGAVEIGTMLITSLIGMAPDIISTGLTLLESLMKGLTENSGKILKAAVDTIKQLANMMSSPDSLKQMLTVALTLMRELYTGLADALPELVTAACDIITGFVEFLLDPENLIEIASTGLLIIEALAVGILDSIPKILEMLWEVFVSIMKFFTDTDWSAVWAEFKTKLLEGLKEPSAEVVAFFSEIWAGIQEIFSVVSAWFSGVFSAAKSGIETAWNTVADFFSGIWDDICFAFQSVGTWFGEKFGEAKKAIETAFETVTDFFSGIWADICGVFADAVNVGKKIVDDIKEGIRNAWDGLVSWFSDLWDRLFKGRKVDVDVDTHENSMNSPIRNGIIFNPYDGFPQSTGTDIATRSDHTRAGTVSAGGVDAIVSILQQILDAIMDGRDTVLTVNNREFARLVRGVV